MKRTLAPAVGDGLSVILKGESENVYQVDCGSKNKSELAFQKMNKARNILLVL